MRGCMMKPVLKLLHPFKISNVTFHISNLITVTWLFFFCLNGPIYCCRQNVTLEYNIISYILSP